MAEHTFEELANQAATVAKDALYVSVGFAILAVQKLQVRRREVADQLEDRLRDAEHRVAEVEHRLDELFADLQTRMPDPAADLLGQARQTVRSARHQVRGFVGRDRDATATTA